MSFVFAIMVFFKYPIVQQHFYAYDFVSLHRTNTIPARYGNIKLVSTICNGAARRVFFYKIKYKVVNLMVCYALSTARFAKHRESQDNDNDDGDNNIVTQNISTIHLNYNRIYKRVRVFSVSIWEVSTIQ